MHPTLGMFVGIVKPKMGRAGAIDSIYHIGGMGNGLRTARIKARMSLEQAANALGLSKGGYTKIERGERGLSADLIRRACELFGVPADELLGDAGGVSIGQEIDPTKLAELISLARERLGVLPLDEAKALILALISASRRPPGPDQGSSN